MPRKTVDNTKWCWSRGPPALYDWAMKTAIGYVRTSTGDQDNSVEVQRTAVGRLALLHGYSLVNVYEDRGVSATVPMGDRPGGTSALQAKTDCLIAWKLDRCFRSACDAQNVLQGLRSSGTAFLSEDVPDTSSLCGKLMFDVLSAVAEMERGRIAERIRATVAKRRANREPVGRVPFGSRLGADGKLVPDEAEQGWLQKMREWRKAGATYRTVAARMDEARVRTPQGGKKWHQSTVQAVLR